MIVVAFSLLAAGPMVPPETLAVDAARDIKANSLSIVGEQHFFEPISIARNGQVIDIGFFGGDALPYFSEMGNAHASLAAYRNQKIAGVALYGSGMALVLADLILLADQSGSTSSPIALEASLLGVGAATSILGAVLVQSAVRHLLDAVAEHNGALVDRYIPDGIQVGLGRDGQQTLVRLGWST